MDVILRGPAKAVVTVTVLDPQGTGTIDVAARRRLENHGDKLVNMIDLN